MTPNDHKATAARPRGSSAWHRAAAAALVLGASVAVMSVRPSPAAAAGLTRTAWWNAANAGPVAPPAPPDVPDDGLYVQGGAPGATPTAFSAVLYDVPSSEEPSTLRLTISGTPSPNFAVQACPIPAGDFAAGPNQPASAAPTYDAAHCAAGQLDATNTTVSFKLSSSSATGNLALAIVPVGPTDRTSFAKPDDASLTTTAATTDSSSPDFSSSDTFATPTPDAAPTATPSAAAAPQETFDFSSALAPSAAPQAPATAAAPQAAAAPAPAARATRIPSLPALSAHPSGTASRVGSLLALALLVAALAAYVRGFGLMGGRITD